MPKIRRNHQQYAWRNSLVLGALVAILGITGLMIPPIARLEPDVGLKWLFNLRGPRPAPEKPFQGDVFFMRIDITASR